MHYLAHVGNFMWVMRTTFTCANFYVSDYHVNEFHVSEFHVSEFNANEFYVDECHVRDLRNRHSNRSYDDCQIIDKGVQHVIFGLHLCWQNTLMVSNAF